MARAVWLYYMCKIIELMDTVFFVLRKKQRQITFLHLYHHTLMPVCGFIGIKYFAGKLTSLSSYSVASDWPISHSFNGFHHMLTLSTLNDTITYAIECEKCAYKCVYSAWTQTMWRLCMNMYMFVCVLQWVCNVHFNQSIPFHVIFFFIHKSHCHAIICDGCSFFCVYSLVLLLQSKHIYIHSHGQYTTNERMYIYVVHTHTHIYTAAWVKRPEHIVFVH